MVTNQVRRFRGKHGLIEASMCLDFAEGVSGHTLCVNLKVAPERVVPPFSGDNSRYLECRETSEGSSRIRMDGAGDIVVLRQSAGELDAHKFAEKRRLRYSRGY
jgi:hypothetical protein